MRMAFLFTRVNVRLYTKDARTHRARLLPGLKKKSGGMLPGFLFGNILGNFPAGFPGNTARGNGVDYPGRSTGTGWRVRWANRNGESETKKKNGNGRAQRKRDRHTSLGLGGRQAVPFQNVVAHTHGAGNVAA